MGLPVVTVAAGGLPVVESTTGGTPVTEAASGYGVPVTKVAALGLPVVFETIGVGPSVVLATFDGVAANMTLSNGNLTATHNAAVTNSGARSTTFLSTGKRYFEVRLDASSTSPSDAIGIGSATATYTQMCANSAGQYVLVYRNTGVLWVSTTNSGKNIAAILPTDVVGIAVDLDARLCWFRRNASNWNGVAGNDPATAVGGVPITAAISYAPIVALGGTTAAGGFTLNCGQSSYANAAPAGFGNWGV